MSILRLDFETHGTVDLPVRGLHNYATDKNTGVWCLAYAFDNEPVDIWVNRHDSRHGRLSLPARVVNHIAQGGDVFAYNVKFEWYLWNFVLRRQYPRLPVLNIDQCHCTQAEALAMSLPDSLDKCGAALGLSVQKDQRGFAVMMQLCKPKSIQPCGTPIWHTDPEKFDILYEYCKTDVATEREMSKRVRRLTPDMRKVWILDHEINYRGVHLDSESIALCKPLVEAQKAAYSYELSVITGGLVTKTTQHKRFKDWCVSQGVELDSVGKPARAALFLEDEQQGYFSDIPSQVIKAMHVWDDASFSSTAKLERAQDLVCSDGRLRGMYQYHAAGTGRFGGRGVQTQNLTRPPKGWKRKHALELFDLVKKHGSEGILDALRLYYGNPVAVISASMRALFMAAPGCDLNSSDLSGIESRGLAYLAGEQWKLDAHAAADAGTARDVYCVVYAQSFHIDPKDVDDEQRQIGKVEDLACGYQGWVGAFNNMANVYGVKLPEEQVIEIIKAFRASHQATVKLWADTERAAVHAVLNPGKEFHAGKHLAFHKDGSFLFMTLPSGREIAYPYPKVVSVERFGKIRQQVEYYGVDTKTKQWAPQRTYGGFWCIQKGTPVLTRRGWVPIQKVTNRDTVWDGLDWVKTGGAVFRGNKEVIKAHGVYMTGDHLILTEKGWVCASQSEGHNRANCGLPEGYKVPRVRQKEISVGVSEGTVGVDGHRRNDFIIQTFTGCDGGSTCVETQHMSEVYDLLNCGDRHRFVVLSEDGTPLIVHNCENATQGFAFDVFAHGLVKAHEAGLNIVMHTHDEITVESQSDVLKQLAECMASVPQWAIGLPLSSKGWTDKRYWK